MSVVSEKKIKRLNEGRIQHTKGKIHPFIACEYEGSLHTYAQKFLNNKDPLRLANKPAQVLLLLGYPGQGKTSFTKRLMYDLLGNRGFSQKVLLVRLRALQQPRELLNNPFSYLCPTSSIPSRKSTLRPHRNLSLKNLAIILDGLDELYMKEGLTNDDIDEFCKVLLRISESHKKLKIILTSRYGYLNTEKFPRQKLLMLRLQPLSLDQQKNWLEKYKQDRFYPFCRLSAEKLEEINDPNRPNFAHIRELINQPILLQMVAAADFDIQASDTRATLYEKVIQHAN